jgi:AcrR family transcriptional regulator
MARPKLKECERKEIQRSIINAALQMAKEMGIESLTLRNVARKAGCCAANIYEYFENKEALLSAMTAFTCNTLHDQLSGLKQTHDAASDLLAMMQATIDFHINYPESCDLLSHFCFQPGKAPMEEFESSVCLFAKVLRRLNSPKLQTKAQLESALDILRVILTGATKLIAQQETPEGRKRMQKTAKNAFLTLLSSWQSK